MTDVENINACINREDVVCENITSYLKNHWTKHRLVCNHFDAFSMLISNTDTVFDKLEFF